MLEYRVLSAAMYANDDLIRTVWDGVANAITAFNMGKLIPESKLVRNAIDNSDTALARELIKAYCIPFKKL